MLILLGMTILLVALFDFTNGFHDASDMIATAIAARAMTPLTAILLVTASTFIAPFLIGLAVADTIGTFVDLSPLSPEASVILVLSALLSAISFNLFTWWLGFPSSSSHSLAGGLVGAGLFSAGPTHIVWGVEELTQGHLQGVMKIAAGLFLSPMLGFAAGFLIQYAFRFGLKHFRRSIQPALVLADYFCVAWLGFSHGANDAQKGMAIIGMMLLAGGFQSQFQIPFWVIVLCSSAITLGTLFGGWRIVKTLGFDLFRVRITHALSNQLGAALVNSIATTFGAPTSTSQVVTASLVGSGAAEKPAHVRWQTLGGIVSGWWLNLPVCILLGSGFCWLLGQIYRAIS